MAGPRTTAAPAPRPARKRAAAASSAAAAAARSTAPIKLYTQTAPEDEIEMVPLFSIDDVDYLIPKNPNALMALRYLDAVRDGTQDMAMAYLLRDLLGPEAYQGLLGFKGHLSPEQLAELFQAAQNAVAGLVEVPKDA